MNQSRSAKSDSKSMTNKHNVAPSHEMVLAELAPMDGSLWKLVLHPLEFKRDKNPDLTPLLNQPGAKNPFFDPAFLMASRDRMAKSQIHQLIVWETAGNQIQPRLSLPIIHITSGMTTPDHWKTLTHPFAPLGDPLLVQKDSDEVMTRFQELLKIAFADGFPPILIDYISAQSPMFDFKRYLPENAGIALNQSGLGSRASIEQQRKLGSDLLISKKRNRELNRLLRKLQELGDVSFEKVTDPFDILLRFEEYLLLEARGWKGRNGTSIHAIKRDAAFARQSVMDLARDQRCEIYSLRLDGKAIASILLFRLNGGYFPWKTTFNADYARYSPGSILMNRLTDEIVRQPDFQFADSLAVFGTSWMTHLWPDQTEFKQLILGGDQLSVETLARRITLRSGLRQTIKKILGKG